MNVLTSHTAAVKEYISMLNVIEKIFLAQSEFMCGGTLTIAGKHMIMYERDRERNLTIFDLVF